ncbi:MAG: anaerobic ribonucleoside-triphosphate reductase activating protein, partial [Firmicutes bacterium]|nr:anaerobic ribonucleoside-triphosphate reductase activating protein [Bacillota bacterium]
KDISLKFRGSSNQRLIDVQASLRQKQVVLLAETA